MRHRKLDIVPPETPFLPGDVDQMRMIHPTGMARWARFLVEFAEVVAHNSGPEQEHDGFVLASHDRLDMFLQTTSRATLRDVFSASRRWSHRLEKYGLVVRADFVAYGTPSPHEVYRTRRKRAVFHLLGGLDLPSVFFSSYYLIGLDDIRARAVLWAAEDAP